MLNPFRLPLVAAVAAVLVGSVVQAAPAKPPEPAPEPAQPYPKVVLPPNVEAAVKIGFPQATIVLLRLQTLHGLDLYDVFLREGNTQFNTWVTQEGLILSVVRPMGLNEFPKVVAAVIAETAAGAKVEKSWRVEWRGKLQVSPKAREPAQATKLDTPEVVFRATLMNKAGERAIVEVDATGKVVREPKWDIKEKPREK